MKCRICDNTESNKQHEIKEMLFGLGEKFIYFQCASCQCLQIATIPKDISKYYPKNYYSFDAPFDRYEPLIKRLIKQKRDRSLVLKNNLLGKLINVFLPNKELDKISGLKLNKNSSVLDVGCGSGYILHMLKEIGINNVLGIDPNNDKDITYKNNLQIEKKQLQDIKTKWDFIMFHHSFEHFEDPLKTLEIVSTLLNKNGVCLIRIPIVPCAAWAKYKADWVQIDAPRHFFIHSLKSMDILTKKTGFNISNIIYDSNELQFCGSEQYKKNISIMSDKSYYKNKNNSIFSKKEINFFKKQSMSLNKKRMGDQVALFLTKN